MTTTFKNFGIPTGFVSEGTLVDPALLASNVPPFGGQVRIELDPETAAPVPKYGLVTAAGQLVKYVNGENLVVIGEDAEATRDALDTALGDNEDATSTPASTNVINLDFAASPIRLSAASANIMTVIGTTVEFTGLPTAGQTLTVGAVEYSFVAADPGENEIEIAATPTLTATNAAAVIDGNPAVSLVDATGTTLSINFVASPAILSTDSSSLDITLGAAVLISDQPAQGDTITVGSVTYTFVEDAPEGGELIGAARGVCVTPITQADLNYAAAQSEPVYVMVATSGNFLLEGLALDESIAALSNTERLRVVRAAMASAGDNLICNTNRFAAT